MEQFDPKTAGEVWRRVLMGPAGDAGVEALLIPALEALADYRQLAAVLGGRAGQTAFRLHSAQRETVETIRGLMKLSGCEDPGPKAIPPARGNAEACIQRSYHRARRAAAEYTARTAEPLTGAAFRVLAAREEQSCALLASLLGM